jgi:hypothetical protein
MSNTA